jgi:LPLT family lysophospholipid transporter-like MFS transporter
MSKHSIRVLGAVYVSQALSAFADNALLIIAIALLKASSFSAQIPWLQAGFILPFVLLAPYVGVLADSLPKGKVLFLGNGIKLIGAGLIWLTPLTLIGYAVVGIGAAIYSPAKYGILGQLVNHDKLVRANGWMEASTLVAILLGVVVGGLLADRSLHGAMLSVVLLYATAMLLNRLIPTLNIERTYQGETIAHLSRAFVHEVSLLWHDRDARLSLTGTSLFWALGSSLRLMLFAWVPVALLINDNQLPATLMGLVSIGIMLGAGLAAWLLPLQLAKRAIWGGLALAPLLLVLAFTQQLDIASVLLIALGIAGGWFVVPLNAVLQRRGHQSIGTGRALAVQNLFENIAMLLAVSVYGLVANHFNINTILIGYALVLGTGMLILIRFARRAVHLVH